MLPIMVSDGNVMPESLDIIEALDKENKLHIAEIKSSSEFKTFEELLNKLGSNVHSLAMPYWIYTPEFDEKSREYFQKKKELKRGPFNNLVHNRKKFEMEILEDLEGIELKPFYKSKTFSAYDIMLASHIWGLYVVPEFQFSAKIHSYLQSVKDICQFDYHQDFWK